MTRLRIADDQSGDERAIRGAEADQTGNRRPAETEREPRQRRQFLVLGDLVEIRQVDLAAPGRIQDQPDQERHRADHHRNLRIFEAVAAERADGQHHRHHGDILGDQHADRDLPDTAPELADVVENLDRHRRRRHGDDETQQHGKLPRESGQPGKPQRHRRRSRDLEQRRRDGDLPDPHEGPERQFHTDDEQQHEDAHFGQHLDTVADVDEPEPGRAQRDAGDDIADDGRLAQAFEHETEYQCAERDNRNPGQIDMMCGFHVANITYAPRDALPKSGGILVQKARDRARPGL